MKKLTTEDLLKLEDYAGQRSAMRAEAITRKKVRKLHLGPHLTLLFEDRYLVQYQVQEMLRIEKVFEKAAIQDELDAYNPLIPDGSNFKATCLIEFEDEGERRKALVKLKGIEDLIWVQVGDGEKVMAIADEDMDRANEEKTSAVHFLRFELAAADIARLRGGAPLHFGVSHPAYSHEVEAGPATRESLLKDLD